VKWAPPVIAFPIIFIFKPGSSSPATWPDGQQLVEVVGVELACAHGSRGRALTRSCGGRGIPRRGEEERRPVHREGTRVAAVASRAGASSSSAASRAGASSSAAAMPTGGNQSAAASQEGASSPAAAMAEKMSSRWCREEQRERLQVLLARC
jgi:hypothetical protein